MRGRVLFLAISLALSSCFPSMDPGEEANIYLKRIESPAVAVDWYYRSLVGGATPDRVVAMHSAGHDTICVAENIIDVNIYYPDSLVVTFDGPPTAYDKRAKVLSQLRTGQVVHVDTAGIPVVPHPRPTFRSYGLNEPGQYPPVWP
jgi:hypothetical protein